MVSLSVQGLEERDKARQEATERFLAEETAAPAGHTGKFSR